MQCRCSTFSAAIGVALAIILSIGSSAAPAADQPYKVVNKAKVGGDGGFDYVFADADGRRLYIPRSARPAGRVDVYDLETLKPVGTIPNTNGVHGVAVDPSARHGFSSSNPVVMFDTKSLATIKTIDVQGNPDGIFFDPATKRVFVLSHREPNVTAINTADGSIAGTVNLDGAPEQGQSDGKGRIYIDVEDKDNVAVVDPQALKVIAHYELGEKGKGPAGLALDAEHGILFACCRNQTAVILNAADGKILTSVPIGSGVDGAGFNPNTSEAFSSQRDGTLTIIKESGPTSFAVEQNVQTMPGAKTSTLDSKTNQIYLIAAEQAPASQPSSQPAATAQAADGGGARQGRGPGRGGRMVPGSFTIIVVGK